MLIFIFTDKGLEWFSGVEHAPDGGGSFNGRFNMGCKRKLLIKDHA